MTKSAKAPSSRFGLPKLSRPQPSPNDRASALHCLAASAYKAAFPLVPGRGLNGRPRGFHAVGLSGPASGVPAFRAFEPFPKGSRGLAPRRARAKKERAFMPWYKNVYLARQDASAQQVEE